MNRLKECDKDKEKREEEKGSKKGCKKGTIGIIFHCVKLCLEKKEGLIGHDNREEGNKR
ncbi:MAG: hypothetical protein LBT18_00760 [Endomicrobium sp.]|nr:hypothetical protein [Endomicrobium sp.]